MTKFKTRIIEIHSELHESWNKWNETIVEREVLKIIINPLGKGDRILRVNKCRY